MNGEFTIIDYCLSIALAILLVQWSVKAGVPKSTKKTPKKE